MELALKIAQLETLSLPELRKLWKKYYGTDCDTMQKDFYVGRIAYRMQELALGGLTLSTKKLIADICVTNQRRAGLPPVGTRIIREYKGIEYSVKVLSDGFEFNGDKFTSLSGIAKLITGTKVSGRFFFGLEKK